MSSLNLKNATVADVLAYYGKDISYHRGGFLFSPFRSESTPSFHVSPNGRAWTDHGSGEGGGIFDLIMKLEPTSDRSEAQRICTAIERGERPVQIAHINRAIAKESAEGFIVRSDKPLVESRRYLVDYAVGRGIDASVLCRFCREVCVSPSNYPDIRNTYIGFRNSAGTWVLRSDHAKYGKRSTGCYPTYIASNGETLPTSEAVSSSPVVHVFEGFFDFLSYMTMAVESGIAKTPSLSPGEDICVLNSVSNVATARDFILSHGKVILYLDNDDAGRKTSEFIRTEARESSGCPVVEDRASYYSDCNDLNDYLRKHGGAPP